MTDHSTSDDRSLIDTIAGRLAASSPTGVDQPDTGLRGRLAEQAERSGLLDVSYRTIDSPVGALLLAATPRGLVRVAFDCEGHDRVLRDLAERISPRILASPNRLDDTVRQLDEYFDGRRAGFEIDLDLHLVEGFQRRVLEQLRRIGYGTTASYSDVAARSGSPRASRAVGSACAHNPVPIVVPCHRVVRSDGTLGQYLGGVEMKRALLELESG